MRVSMVGQEAARSRDRAAFFMPRSVHLLRQNRPSDFWEVNLLYPPKWGIFPRVNIPEIVNPPPHKIAVG